MAYLITTAKQFSFNTQPPEGGWFWRNILMIVSVLFQHTAARRRLDGSGHRAHEIAMFQHTAARRRLARLSSGFDAHQRFNTQPPEGGWYQSGIDGKHRLEFQHTAARRRLVILSFRIIGYSLFQHTAARRRLGCCRLKTMRASWFQHTAARRRLEAYPH